MDPPSQVPWAPALPPPPGSRGRRSQVVSIVLFFCTLVSTTTLGVAVYLGSRTDVTTDLTPFLSPRTFATVWGDAHLLLLGLRFSIPLMSILLAHEMGHYLACRYYRIASSPPYFLPSPFFIGTFGAFIRIRQRIPGRRELFDIGLAGPIAGFVMLLPFLVLGIAWSSPGVVFEGDASNAVAQLYRPGSNLAIAGVSWLFFGPLPTPFVLNLHPFALAAWVGLLLTALNLLPLGQLDGGHVVYALLGRTQRRIAWPLWFLLASAGWIWRGWLVWCVLILFLGLRHPPVAGESVPLDRARKRLGWVALALFLVCFTPEPLAVILVRSGEGPIAAAAPPSIEVEHEGHRTFVSERDAHLSSEAARLDRQSLSTQRTSQLVDEASRELRARSTIKRRAPSPVERAGKGELRHEKDFTGDLTTVELHATTLVAEDS